MPHPSKFSECVDDTKLSSYVENKWELIEWVPITGKGEHPKLEFIMTALKGDLSAVVCIDLIHTASVSENYC